MATENRDRDVYREIMRGAGARTPGAIREAVRVVLGEGAYREGAERAREMIAALPGPGEAVALLERLAVEKQPLPTAD
jgi:UDP:flavonoid glycosyltransferase YjiC (YdhE family)